MSLTKVIDCISQKYLQNLPEDDGIEFDSKNGPLLMASMYQRFWAEFGTSAKEVQVIIVINNEAPYRCMGVDIGQMVEGYSVSDLQERGIDIVNASGTFDLEGEFDRAKLHENLPSTEYDPEKHRSLIYRGDAATILLPPTGRVSIVRATTPDEINRGVKEFLSELHKVGIKRNYSNVQVENIVGTADLNREFDLNAVTITFGLEHAEYEPEQFPGVIYRIPNGAVVLIFGSGKVVITKSMTYADVVDAFEHVRERLNNTFELRE